MMLMSSCYEFYPCIYWHTLMQAFLFDSFPSVNIVVGGEKRHTTAITPSETILSISSATRVYPCHQLKQNGNDQNFDYSRDHHNRKQCRQKAARSLVGGSLDRLLTAKLSRIVDASQ